MPPRLAKIEHSSVEEAEADVKSLCKGEGDGFERAEEGDRLVLVPRPASTPQKRPRVLDRARDACAMTIAFYLGTAWLLPKVGINL